MSSTNSRPRARWSRMRGRTKPRRRGRRYRLLMQAVLESRQTHTDMRKRRTPLPAWRNLHHDRDAEPSIEAFTTWYTQRHGTRPGPDAVAPLAYEWLEGILPGTERVVAPARIRFFRSLMDDDWIPDEPVTVGVKALLPDWVRWNGEQDGLPAHLLDHAVATATDTTSPPTARLSIDEVDRVR